MIEPTPNPNPKRLSRRRMVVFSLLVVGAVALAWSLGWFHREPLHKGRPISYWVDRACLGFDANDSWAKRSEVRDIGPAAVPYLVAQLQTTDRWRSRWNSLREHLPSGWQERFPAKPPAQELHYGAARTLVLFGPAAKPAVPDLARLLPELKYPALDALTAIGPDAKAALPALHDLLTNRDVNLRVDIARALWKIGRETNTVIDICTNAMLSGTDCLNAPNVLIDLKASAAPATPVALLVLQDTNRSPGMRANSAIFLGIASADTPEVRAALLAGTREGQVGNLRANCAMALWNLDPQYADLATRLVMEDIVSLRKQFPGNEQNIAFWLEYRELDPRGAMPTLKELADAGSDQMRKEAAEQIKKIEARPKPKANQ